MVIEPKILLFYKFTPLADPDAIRLWQRELCERWGLTGRILLSKNSSCCEVSWAIPLDLVVNQQANNKIRHLAALMAILALGQEFFDNSSLLDSGESQVQALVLERESLVVDP